MVSTDTSSFAALVERHQGQVFAVAYGVLGDRALAEEVAQDAFLVGWGKILGGARVDAPAAWLCGIARNLARNARRKPRGEELLSEVGSGAPSAVELLEERDRRTRVQTALHRLPDRYREPLVLFYVEGESVERVADALSLSSDVVRQRLHRGREQLRTELGTVEPELKRTRPSAEFVALVVAAWSTRGAIAHATPVVSIALVASALFVTAGTAALVVHHAHTAQVAAPIAHVAAPPTSTPRKVPSSNPTRAVAHATSTSTPTTVVPSLATRFPMLNESIDIDLGQASARMGIDLIGRVSQMPAVVVGPLDADVNMRYTDAKLGVVLDEVLAQAGAMYEQKDVLTIAQSGDATIADGSIVTIDFDGKLVDAVRKLGVPVFVPDPVSQAVVHVHDTQPAGVLLRSILTDAQLGLTLQPGIEVRAEEEP